MKTGAFLPVCEVTSRATSESEVIHVINLPALFDQLFFAGIAHWLPDFSLDSPKNLPPAFMLNVSEYAKACLKKIAEPAEA
jgi:hypothetical protein